MMVALQPPLYTFIDEGGNTVFTDKGTRFFTMTSVTMCRPFPIESQLTELRFNLLEAGIDLECFHASEDKQWVRDEVFALIQGSLSRYRVDSVIAEKRKCGPALRPVEKLYPRILAYLLRYLVNGTDWSRWSELIVITARLEEKKKRKALEAGIRAALKDYMPEHVSYRVYHRESASCNALQIADYFNWAIEKSWKDDDSRSLDPLRAAVKSQFDLFQMGSTLYY